jgi:non-ribosomal peptide synthetase component F
LIEGLAANHVSRIVLVPSLLRVLLDSFGDLHRRLPELRLWVTSGEEIPLELAKRFREAMPQARLVNMYGSSEVSADVTCYEIGGGLQGQRVPIGRPIDNTQVHLLDRTCSSCRLECMASLMSEESWRGVISTGGFDL